MRTWTFKVLSSSKEVIEKLESTFGSVDGSVFKTQNGSDSLKFNFRKRVLYPDQILHRNRVIVNGVMRKTNVENETNVEITFRQHIVLMLTVSTWFIGGLFALVLGLSGSPSAYIPGVILLVIGIVFWIAVQKKFEKDTEKYKILITEILGL
jgi:hypothetical protein